RRPLARNGRANSLLCFISPLSYSRLSVHGLPADCTCSQRSSGWFLTLGSRGSWRTAESNALAPLPFDGIAYLTRWAGTGPRRHPLCWADASGCWTSPVACHLITV